jgi:hypothetical protein
MVVLAGALALEGCVVIDGSVSTDRVAAFVVALPAVLVNTARNSAPLSDPFVLTERVAEFARATPCHVDPRFVEVSHRTARGGEPEALARNRTVVPMGAARLEGLAVTFGTTSRWEPARTSTDTTACLDVLTPSADSLKR